MGKRNPNVAANAAAKATKREKAAIAFLEQAREEHHQAFEMVAGARDAIASVVADRVRLEAMLEKAREIGAEVDAMVETISIFAKSFNSRVGEIASAAEADIATAEAMSKIIRNEKERSDRIEHRMAVATSTVTQANDAIDRLQQENAMLRDLVRRGVAPERVRKMIKRIAAGPVHGEEAKAIFDGIVRWGIDTMTREKMFGEQPSVVEEDLAEGGSEGDAVVSVEGEPESAAA